ncbi:ATP-grasp domain-containing protein [Pseudemcibacter aquimaris]|uniref:ATP-grasp domain-containing protein n=1 Tax=Pseudemcibacter aquimaris TaxID=2857064 RepID=UPI0020127670|nr:ATP-grasp domain-containing protein [Pseudemcibacter aquimaris]MCC3862581.1 ATP-grasp domain-containing protein [Pseudemcibacter aquimaris]WDU57901.1 ATP-grasp domain-containing protein [Pseudemcibacter aquimaris]
MNNSNAPIETRIFHGPNIVVPFKAIVVDFEDRLIGGDGTVSSKKLADLKKIIPETFFKGIENHDGWEKVPGSAAIDAFQFFLDCFINLNIKNKTYIDVSKLTDGRHRIVTAFYYADETLNSIDLSFQITSFLTATNNRSLFAHKNIFENKLNALVASMKPNIISDFLEFSKKHKIPTYHAGYTKFHFILGQGTKGIVYNFASNEFDSLYGYYLQKNKKYTHEYLKKLGIPVADQIVVKTMEQCLEAVKNIGFPVVIKPLSEGQGRGVSVNICNLEQAKKAFLNANKYDARTTLVEKFIEGDVYRITLSQGNLNTVYEMIPAFVIGNGKDTISGLMQTENKFRKKERAKGLSYIDLVIDDSVISELANNNMDENTVLKDGQKVFLRRTSNTASGGTYRLLDDDDAHPDVRELMLDLPKLFRLDNVGIDYVTTDISKSWRENGAIIEVNAFPSVENFMIENIFINHFGEELDCRIKSKLIISNQDQYVVGEIQHKTGFVSANSTIFKGGELALNNATIYERCLALMLNKTCEGITVKMTEQEIDHFGLPLDYFDECILDDTVSEDTAKWIEPFVGQISKQ